MRVRGEGSTTSGLMLVGPWPGRDDDRTGRPFSGKGGAELDVFLDGVALPERDDFYITTLIKQWGGKDADYTVDDFERDRPAFEYELERIKPRIIVTLGREPTRRFLGDVDMDDVHGIPWEAEGRIIFPCYSIAAGFRNAEIAGTVLYDFQQAAALFAGELKPRTLYDDPYPTPTYIDILSPDQVNIDPAWPLSVDTEGWAGNVWSIQYSQQPGLACVIRCAAGREVVEAFKQALEQHQPTLVYQSALHDLSVLRAVGIETSQLRFEDTAVMAYLLQAEPRGLKPLCVRHCNMRMQSYDDVMGDAANRLASDYFISLLDIEEHEYRIRQDREFARINNTPLVDAKTGLPKRTKAGAIKYRVTRVLPTILKTRLHAAVIRGLRSREPRKLWEKWEDTAPDVRVMAEDTLGFLPEPTLDHVERGVALHYAARDADGTGRLLPELSARIDAMGLREVYEIEMATYPLIDRMHHVGMRPDLPHFAAMSEDLGYELADLQVQLEHETGMEGFNANSGDQVADYVFDRLGLQGYKRTESGRFSTNDKVLEALEREHPEHPVLSTIRSFRETFKLKGTFVDRIPDYVHRWPHDGRVHATFRTTRVVTGRLAASDPNLLAQPEHGKFAKRFKRGWVADDGHVLCNWDQSQIELRAGAHLSQDPYMLRVYRGEVRNADGSLVDLHAGLAHRIFGVLPAQQDKSKHRLPSKAINFGFWMGQTKYGLMVELRKNGIVVDEDDAQRWLDEANATYVGAQVYKDHMIAEARRQGYIRCPLSGRIRYIGGIKSFDERVRSEAERFAFSTPVQETAQMIMKQAEANVWRDIVLPYERRGIYVQPLVQVHDALKMECEVRVAHDLHTQMVRAMTEVPKTLSVPLVIDGEWGPNLADMQGFVG